ncbi:peroxiredoxin [Fulvivirga lutea]|uniref:thioredoxin-dependent peroxiredoxin n=1 Tax=Fulvivirga lutea TaxID=2810512 RepID=A0A974WIJ0_9BACT|nr:peroxiredoxin [Fulvivirga lutea]QSE96785.1 peroxiredoxin [Fulvivirga lutea]
MALKLGSKAPRFSLPSSNGSVFKLEDQKGSPLVLYFYPKNFTPGCTKEACSFRDHHDELQELDVKVVGISRDSVSSHKKFKEKHNLNFELLSDQSGDVCKLYDALIPVLNIPKRITYLLDSDLKIQYAFDSLFGYKAHIENAIKALKTK